MLKTVTTMAESPIKVTRVVQTCRACPSQWDAWTPNGNYVYIRYRYGHLTVDVDNSPVFSAVVGDRLDGSMTWDEVLTHAPLHVQD